MNTRSIVAGIMAMMLLSGCSSLESRVAQLNASIPSVARSLQGMEVRNELGVSSTGYPISSQTVVVSAHAFEDWGRAAAVNDYPMLLANLAKRMQLDRTALPSAEDWLLATSPRARFAPDRIDPRAIPAVGDTVYFAGFPYDELPKGTPDRDIKKSVVAGIVIDGDPIPDSIAPAWTHAMRACEGLVLVAVPPRDYGGMSGGPAAIVADDGRLSIWGTFVLTCGVYVDGKSVFAAGFAPLPAGVLEDGEVRVYESE